MVVTQRVTLSQRAFEELTLRKRKDPLAWLQRLPRISKKEAERRIAQIEADRDASTEPA